MAKRVLPNLLRASKTLRFAAAAVALSWIGEVAVAQSSALDVPIVIGGSQSFAACPGGGEVFGLDPDGDAFLSVRSGPGGRPYHEVDRVHNGMRVKVCDMIGSWFAVVYDPSGSADRCGVERILTSRQPYAGPCRQGWVYSRYLNIGN